VDVLLLVLYASLSDMIFIFFLLVILVVAVSY
jgi:hypothetical protein